MIPPWTSHTHRTSDFVHKANCHVSQKKQSLTNQIPAHFPQFSPNTLFLSVISAGVSFTVSGMIPSWKIDTAAPIFSAFGEHDLEPLKKLLAIGAIAGLQLTFCSISGILDRMVKHNSRKCPNFWRKKISVNSINCISTDDLYDGD